MCVRCVSPGPLKYKKKACNCCYKRKMHVTVPRLRRVKVHTSCPARRARQGFAARLLGFEAGFAPSSSPGGVQPFTSERFFSTR